MVCFDGGEAILYSWSALCLFTYVKHYVGVRDVRDSTKTLLSTAGFVCILSGSREPFILDTASL